MSIICFKFYYNGEKKEYTCRDDDIIEVPFKEFALSENKNIKDFVFYYKACFIKDYSKMICNSIFSQSKTNSFDILVILLKLDESKKKKKEEKNIIIKNETKEEKKEEKEDTKKDINEYYDIICPYCKTSAIIDIDNDNEKKERSYSLKILNCENFHNLTELNYDIYNQFNIFDLKDDSKENLNNLIPYSDLLVCGMCNGHKKDMTPPEDELYFCYNCEKNICSTCKITHDKNHKIFPLVDKNYYCIKHAKIFNSYCIDCNCNICEDCKNSHPDNEHQICDFDQLKPTKEDINKWSENIQKHKNQLKNFISATKELFNKMITTVESYINSYIVIENTLIKRYKFDGLMNFQLIRNITNENIFENILFKELENYSNENKPSSKRIEFLSKIYSQINDLKKPKDKSAPPANPNNKIVLTYLIQDTKKRNIRLFDEIFVKNNKDRLSVNINGENQKNGLTAYYDNTKDEAKLNVILQEKGKSVTDMSYMLNNCKNIITVNFQWNTINVTSMEAMFQLTPLTIIPKEICKFSTPKLTNIRALFCKCVKITSIPDIANIFNRDEKINQINNISMLFNGCKNLNNINGNNWYANKIEDMSYAFNRCEKLENIHLSNININNVRNMCGLFNGCKKLKKIPSLKADFNSQKVEDISIMFQDCEILESIDASKYNTSNVKDMNGIFSGCKNLKRVILKNWNLEKVQEMIGVFNNCISLVEVTFGKLNNLTKVKNASGMFYRCKKLKTIKYIENLKFLNENVKIENFFDQCGFEKKEEILKGLVQKKNQNIIK